MRRARLYVVAAAVVVAVVVGLRSCGPSTAAEDDPNGGVTPTVDTPTADAGVGPAKVVDGVPQGWSHDQSGARAAAVSAVSLTGDIAQAGFISRADMVEDLATVRYGPVLARESSAQLAEMTGELGAAAVTTRSILFRELPLTARTLHADDLTAQVEVWTVLVVGVPNSGSPRQVWRTVTIDLAWESSDWRIDGWIARSGPTPALATNAPVASVDELVVVASWPSMVGGE